MWPPAKAFATRCGLLRALSLLRRFSTWRSTVLGAIPSCCAHCLEESPRAMHSSTWRSRSDRVTKSSCCRGMFTISSLSRGIHLVISASIRMARQGLQALERAVPVSDSFITENGECPDNHPAELLSAISLGPAHVHLFGSFAVLSGEWVFIRSIYCYVFAGRRG